MVYVGSKARLARFIAPIIQKIIDDNKIKTYIEPFVGGANLIDKIFCERRFGYDLHDGLIGIYNAVKSGWLPPSTITEQDYINAKMGQTPEPLRSYIGFNGSYVSKYWGGFARGFKADGITPRDIYNERTRNFIEQIPKLQDIEFRVTDYKTLQGDSNLFYCDPPYKGTTEYSVKGFNHAEFWDWVRETSHNNIVLVSEFNAPEDFEAVWEKERSSSLDKNTGGKKDIERLFKLK